MFLLTSLCIPQNTLNDLRLLLFYIGLMGKLRSKNAKRSLSCPLPAVPEEQTIALNVIQW